MIYVKKAWLFILCAVITVLVLAPYMTLAAQSLKRVTQEESLPRFTDDMGLLTAEQAFMLTETLNEISVRHRFDVVIAVVRRLDTREARLYAIDFFEDNGFGVSFNNNGAILLLAIEGRDFGFAAKGDNGLRIFTMPAQRYLDRCFLPFLRENQYYEGFIAFAEAMDELLGKAEDGIIYTTNVPLTALEKEQYRLWAIIGSLGLSLIISFTVVLIWKSKLISVRSATHAGAYIKENSMFLRIRNDIFIHRHVHRVRRAQSSGSGGSFTSSSGSSSTGHSGKF